MANALAILEKRLRKGQRRFTMTEAAAVTGLSLDEARDGLDLLMAKYICRLQVTENGDLIVDFGESLRRRGEKSFSERMNEFREWLWKIFKVIYKAWIALTLIIYFVIFLVILLALLVAAGSQKGKSRKSPVNLDAVLRVFYAIFRWQTSGGATVFRTDRRGYRYREYQPPSSILKPGKKNFIAAVYDFVFGPARVEVDPLHNPREVAAFLKENRGILLTADLQALAGWNAADAEAFFTDCLVRFRGDVKVSENGVVYGQFDEITRVVGEGQPAPLEPSPSSVVRSFPKESTIGSQDGKIEHYWDEYEPEYELTGNSPAYNFAILVMNGFNLLFSFAVLNGLLGRAFVTGEYSEIGYLVDGALHANPATAALLGWIPFIFSALFFLIPLVRWFGIRRARRRRYRNNLRKRFFKAIFNSRGEPRTAQEILRSVNTGAAEEPLSSAAAEKILGELLPDLQGETVLTEEGELAYAFPRIRREMEEAPRLRARRTAVKELGDVIMDSE